MLSWKRTTKALTRLRGCAGWSVPLIFACNKIRFSLGDSQLLSVDHLSWLTDVFIISPHELTTIKEIVGVEFLNFDIFDAEPLCNILHQCLVCIRNILETQKEKRSSTNFVSITLQLCVSCNRPSINLTFCAIYAVKTYNWMSIIVHVHVKLYSEKQLKDI